MSDLVKRLRGVYAQGPIMENGKPEFGYRHFDDLPAIHAEAADEIERLTAENGRLRHDIEHYLLAFEELGEDSSALRQSECMWGDDCPFIKDKGALENE